MADFDKNEIDQVVDDLRFAGKAEGDIVCAAAADLIDQLRQRLAEVELLNRQLRQDFDNAAWEAESKLAETDRIIRRLWSLMGPKTPPCCEGCTFEWIEALKELRAYLGSDAYPAVPPTIQGPST